jgi:drug/metabolite transporter (DMT)-like permease
MLFAFFAIYFVWGSTFIAIRIAVTEVPPLLSAGIRFAIAGLLLYAWSVFRGQQQPSRREWRNLSILGVLMFLATYSALFWAEKTIPSGVASILVSVLPLVTVLLESLVFRTRMLTWELAIAILVGFAGVAIATGSASSGRASILPSLAILGGESCWALGAVLSRKMQLSSSKTITSGAEMMAGGAMLFVCSFIAGELNPWPHIGLRPAIAIAYLIVFGSVIGFTAFVWLLGRLPATIVSSHAYINPLVALALGYWIGGEALRPYTLMGAAFVVGSVFVILKSQRPGASE